MITYEYEKPWYVMESTDPRRVLIIWLHIPENERVETPVHYHDRLHAFSAMCLKLGMTTDIGYCDGVVLAEKV